MMTIEAAWNVSKTAKSLRLKSHRLNRLLPVPHRVLSLARLLVLRPVRRPLLRPAVAVSCHLRSPFLQIPSRE